MALRASVASSWINHLIHLYFDNLRRKTHLIFKIDEGKAPAAARVTIQHYLDLLQRAILLKLRLEFPLAGVQRQPEHPEALAGLRVVTVALVTSSARHRGPGMVPATASSSSSSRVLPLSGRRRPGPRPGPWTRPAAGSWRHFSWEYIILNRTKKSIWLI